MYKNKKLLIIGASVHFIDVVKLCKDIGLTTVVIDYNPRAKAKVYADIALDVDTYDHEAVLKVAQKYNVDGVFVGWSDMNLYTAEYVCQILNLPFYATKEQLFRISNKDKFKKLCIKYDVPTVPEVKIDKIKETDFPVIVKPVDNGGSRGIYKCSSLDELEDRIEKSKAYSPTGEIIIEKYLELQHINIYYTFANGEAYLSSICDRHVIKPEESSPPLPVVLVHDSEVYEQFLLNVDPKLRDLFSGLDMNNGVAFVQAFTNGREFFVYECGYRLNGGSTYFYMDYFQNYNQARMLIDFALFGDMEKNHKLPKENIKFPQKGISLFLSIASGSIKEIKGLDVLDKYKEVLGYITMYGEGDEIPAGEFNHKQLFLSVFVIAKNFESFQEIAKDIVSNIKVFDQNNCEMMIDITDVINDDLMGWVEGYDKESY